eukprot:CAMPEP_0119179400 /NCGR_PEP_ID=MMETSP1315-20130426/54221_1 /TAXON_ID=676789 /ORGANISM="Prasinoderma singularis, Strain RCC927" /LENGTH=40 /DNA_ID= /DNA_START= /DNA_END= /DNA_ORIENTATION=
MGTAAPKCCRRARLLSLMARPADRFGNATEGAACHRPAAR